MIEFADCQDIRKMAVIEEMDCPDAAQRMASRYLSGTA